MVAEMIFHTRHDHEIPRRRPTPGGSNGSLLPIRGADGSTRSTSAADFSTQAVERPGVKAFTTDGREIECDAVEEGEIGACLLDGDEQVGYVPYDSLAYVLELRSPVASSAIETVGYDEDDHVLEIEFRHGGVYEYFDVPETVYRDLVDRPLAGAVLPRARPGRVRVPTPPVTGGGRQL